MIDTPQAESGRRPSAIERRQREARQSNHDATLIGALEGVADGVISLVQHRFALARHEATQAVRSFGGLVILALVGGVLLGLGLVAFHAACVLLAWTFWGGTAGALTAAGLAALETIIGIAIVLKARSGLAGESQKWAAKRALKSP